MRVRKFISSSYARALDTVKRELGEDALIISSRCIKPARPGVPGEVEITAAIDYAPVENWQSMGNNKPGTNEPDPHFWNNDSLDLPSLVMSMASQSERARLLGLDKSQLGIFQQMTGNGVDEKLAGKIIGKAGRAASETNGELNKDITKLLTRVMDCAGPVQLIEGSQKRVALVGPTGAGKTTTIAKLAADFSLRQKKKVALISLDTYRMGAFDQLKIYGDIMQIPTELAADKYEFQSSVKKHSDKDLILIDTMGRSHQDTGYAAELKEIFATVGNVETHLVASIASQEKILNAVHRQLAPLGLDRALFTKLDEGLNFGSLLNFSLRTRLPFSYFTSGQRVPEDIEIANQKKVIRLIFN
ncbi:MAG: hypothetical protein COV66_12895 [Nitrospinae bacterium CG11_big_fil_rev_8_21_14_0_20_45_15]|nr:MAG: hypothetical protein COV66_12895 [Nitrospinae bacterium CG11_big_fil_rev_8_21_14_0_20_45_15]